MTPKQTQWLINGVMHHFHSMVINGAVILNCKFRVVKISLAFWPEISALGGFWLLTSQLYATGEPVSMFVALFKALFKKLYVSVQISSAVCFLLSPGASLISGATLKVDAGQSLYHSMWDIPGIHMLPLHLHFSRWNLKYNNFIPALLCVFVSRPQRMARTSRGREPGRSEGHAQIGEQTLIPITS